MNHLGEEEVCMREFVDLQQMGRDIISRQPGSIVISFSFSNIHRDLTINQEQFNSLKKILEQCILDNLKGLLSVEPVTSKNLESESPAKKKIFVSVITYDRFHIDDRSRVFVCTAGKRIIGPA